MSTDMENASITTPIAMTTMTQPQLGPSRSPESQPALKKPVVVGLYGIPGSGKTTLLNQLKNELDKEKFTFYEGSEVIDYVVYGGLSAFQDLDEEEKVYWRECAIDTIGKECASSGKVAVVAGHFMLWPEIGAQNSVCTQNDLQTYTHILYLDVPAEVIAQRCWNDTERKRPSASTSHLHDWKLAEMTQLRSLCYSHDILFSAISHPISLSSVTKLLLDFAHHSENSNLAQAEYLLDEALNNQSQLKIVLVMDADRTLAAEDTGAMFWTAVRDSKQYNRSCSPLKRLFSSPAGYSYTAFRQATLLYEENADDQVFEALCQDVASRVTIHPEFVALLQRVGKEEHFGAVVVTCGLRRVWEIVLEKEGLSQIVTVIGGGRIADGIVVTAAVKAVLVTRLQDVHHLYVWAFGDSPLDLEMLQKANQAIVVVGEESTRSKTMDPSLMNAIDKGGLCARQALLPRNASPRLDTTKLPLIELTAQEFFDSIFEIRKIGFQFLHATDRSAAKMLMTPMRNAELAGPALRECHRRVGWYLATEFLTEVIGVEEYSIPHVQGHYTSGFRLLHENRTSIVALMRGGEPMAFGVNDAFPSAMFLHARDPGDVKDHHLRGQHTIVLVDSVINSGKTMVDFVHHVHSLKANIEIVVVAGVVQAQFIASGGFEETRHKNLSLIALRLSDNQFTGRGATDTGNRLFNTTCME